MWQTSTGDKEDGRSSKGEEGGDEEEMEEDLQLRSLTDTNGHVHSSPLAMDSTPSRVHLYQSVLIFARPLSELNCHSAYSPAVSPAESASSQVNGVYLICGTQFAWSSPVLPKLKLEPSVGNSVASMLSLGMVLGPVLSGIVLDPLGRRGTVALSMALMTGSYVLLTFASSVVELSIGRFIAGLTCGITFSAIPLYIAEISEVEVRGFLNTLSQIFCCLGNLLMYSVGPYVSYSVLHYVMLTMCCAFFVLFSTVPQSPFTLVAKKDVEGARQTLAWLRQGRSVAAIEKEVQLVQETIEQNKADKAVFTDLFTVHGNRKALILCCVLLILQQISGISIILFYVQEIFRLTGTAIESSSCAIIIGVIMTASSFFCPIAVAYLGYKKPLLASAAGMAMGMGGLGVFFMLKQNGIEVDSISFMPLMSVITYIVFFNSGFCNIPWALSGELFPNNIKPVATTFVASTCGLVMFFCTNLFSDLINLVGLEILFMSCSFFCCLGIVFISLVVQDTSGLTFLEIQQSLNGQTRSEIMVARAANNVEDHKL